jgi:hypothetical protein
MEREKEGETKRKTEKVRDEFMLTMKKYIRMCIVHTKNTHTNTHARIFNMHTK